jgi:hypothetical protein
MLRKCLFSFSLVLLFASCNSAFRSSNTSIRLSPPVAEYLSQQTLLIHNNQPKLQTRQVTLQAPYADSFYTLTYRKLSGNSLILEVSDSSGKMRNIAIPQTKLKAFPVALTTTATPLTLAAYYSQRVPWSSDIWGDVIMIGISIFNLGTDALTIPLVKLTNKNSRYAVPQNYSLTNLNDVLTLDTNNKTQLYSIAAPVNPQITPFLDADFQKKQQIFIQGNIGVGLFHRSTSTPATLNPDLRISPWYAVDFQVQTSNEFAWGFYHLRSLQNNLQSTVTSPQIAYVNNHLKKAKLVCGVGVGLGTFKRSFAPDVNQSSTLLNGRTLGADSVVMIRKEFIPNLQYLFIPASGFVQYERELGKSLALTIGMRITRIQTNTDYLNYEYLKTWEVIAPGVTAERVQNLGFVTRDRYSAQNMLFHFNTGLKIRLNP